MEVVAEDFGLHPWTCTNFLWQASDHEVEMKGFDEHCIPENDDILDSGSDWAEGNGEVW